MNIKCMTLDEFNFMCYVSMYNNIQSTINYLYSNEGNLFEKYVTIINLHINNMI